MRHATATALDRLEPLLVQLRRHDRLKEKSRGVFYLKSRAVLHFHEDPAGLFADFRESEEDHVQTLPDRVSAFASRAAQKRPARS